jgi:hypothetical protein
MFSSVAKPAPSKPSRSFEEILGLKLLPIIGITVVVLGVGFLVGAEWVDLPAWLRVLILYAGGFALLALGLFFERKGRYKLLGWTLIGGGWAVTALVTYAIANTKSLGVLPYKTADLFLLLAVIGAMVWHTLKYKSQVVTGAGFLLGFVAIGMNPSPPYNLIAGGILIAGMTVIVVRRQWWELEVFGIIASYINHFTWLNGVYSHMGGRATFPDHTASVALVIGYWAIFRTSYLVRKITNPQREQVSTFSALLNPVLFMLVMKYQGFHPEWAWYLLLGMGAVEFILGQLPVSRRRRTPFLVLSSLGAALMVAAPAVRGSGNALEIIWLTGAEVFLLAGILTRERLFRGFGIIISFLVALYAVPVRILPLTQDIVAGQVHHVNTISVVLAVIAIVFYLNAHVSRRRWPGLFEHELEQNSLMALSYVGSVFAVSAVYSHVPDAAVAVALALLVTWLSGTGRLFSIEEMTYQAHWIAAAAFVQVVVADRSLEAVWFGVSQRVMAFASVAALFYLSSRFVRLSETVGRAGFAGAYASAATSLVTLLIYFQAPVWAVAVLWVALGLVLSIIGQILDRTDLKWQAFVLVLLSSGRALTVNMNLVTSFSHVTYRLLTVSAIALGIYLMARWAPLRQIRPVYSVAGTSLLAFLAFKETPEPWTGVCWAGLAVVLCLAARWWKDYALLWQTHLLSALSAGWMLYLFYDPQLRGSRVQWITVGLAAAALYALTWLSKIADVIDDERICQAYAWAGSLLLSWLAWYQLPQISVALAWGVFALLLFEFPEIVRAAKIGVDDWSAASWRAQAYVALGGSFVRIFISNFNVSGWASMACAALLVPIYFYVYWHLEGREKSDLEASFHVDFLIACLGTATLAALARFELGPRAPDAVVVGYAALVLGTLLAAWLTKHQVFLFQALVMLGVTAFRLSMNNFYHLHEAFGSSLTDSVVAIALLACAVPLAYQVRKVAQAPETPGWFGAFAQHPEQPMFFVSVALLAVLLFLKLSGVQLTGAWAFEGFVVFALALWAKERSFRMTGLCQLMLSVGKLAGYDIIGTHNLVYEALTWIGVGLLVLGVGILYVKNRDALKDYV